MSTSSYSGDPQSTPKDTVRFLVGDTGPTFHLNDEEITFLLDSQANVWMAAAMVADRMTVIVSGGGLSSKSVGGLSESYSTGSVQFYREMAASFRLRGRSHQVPTAAEISQKFSFNQFEQFRGPRVRDDQGITYVSEEEE